MSMVEDDGDEVFVPIADVTHCGEKPQPDRGFWRCPKCNVSFGPVQAPSLPVHDGASK